MLVPDALSVAPLSRLETLPEAFFAGQSKLMEIHFKASLRLGTEQRLPDQLFKGLHSLTTMDVSTCRFQNFPSMDDLTVGSGACCGGGAGGGHLLRWQD